MTQQHTDGEWYYRMMDGDPNSDLWLFYVQSGESELCSGAVDNLASKDPDECEANARLIAAAPDLLAACLLALPRMADYGWTDGDRAVTRALRQAIDKATGQEVLDRPTIE